MKSERSAKLLTYPEETRRRRRIARDLADVYRRLPRVGAVFAWGSTPLGDADADSDVDIGIFAQGASAPRRSRTQALNELGVDASTLSFGKVHQLDAYDRFVLRGVPVFVGWWRYDSFRRFLDGRLARLPDRLEDAAAENEIGEIQRALVLWDPDGLVSGLRGVIDAWQRPTEVSLSRPGCGEPSTRSTMTCPAPFGAATRSGRRRAGATP